MSEESLPLICTSCGSGNFGQPTGREWEPDDIITCGGCGRQGTVAVLREQALESAKKLVAERFKNIFKK